MIKPVTSELVTGFIVQFINGGPGALGPWQVQDRVLVSPKGRSCGTAGGSLNPG